MDNLHGSIGIPMFPNSLLGRLVQIEWGPYLDKNVSLSIG